LKRANDQLLQTQLQSFYRENMYYSILGENRDYAETLELMESLRDRVIEGELEEGVILFLSHLPVYTLGIRGKRENILVSEKFIKREKIEIHKTKRGGDITYHGPGQLIIYPILSIKKLGYRSIKEFVLWWGETIASFLRDQYGIKNAMWEEEKTGIWTEKGKIMAVGLHFRHFVSAHGFALNINPNMNHFGGIIPCGIKNSGISSVLAESGQHPDITKLSKELIAYIKANRFKNLREYSI